MNKKRLIIAARLIALFLVFSVPARAATENIRVFFNQPELSTTTSIIANPGIGLDDSLIGLIDSAVAGDTLYACFYRITDASFSGAFNDAAGRGVTVYFISNSSSEQYSNLNPPIEKMLSTGNHLMHNKFLVLKSSAVWTGSANLTEGIVTGNNNAVLIYSEELADIYENEFLYMWNDGAGRFSTDKVDLENTARTAYVDGVRIDVYFSPYFTSFQTDTRSVIEQLIIGAEHSIHFNMFTFSTTESLIINALKNAHDNGVEVKGVVEGGQSKSVQEELSDDGINVLEDGNPGDLHHKFAVIDRGMPSAKVITGSRNWTRQGREEHDENFLVIHSTAVAELYWQEFQKNYSIAVGGGATRGQSAVSNVLVYPSPAKFSDEVTIGYTLSAAVSDVEVMIYTIAGEEVKSFEPDFYTGADNEIKWNLRNSSGQSVAPGLYIVKVAATTGDGVVFDTDKFALIR